jgi:hypothetical protein
MYIQRVIHIMLISLFAFALWSCGSKTTMTESEVREFYTALEQAINQKNIDKVLASLSDDAQLEGTIFSGGESQKLSLSKQEYADQIRQTFEAMSNYSYKIEKLDIQMSADSTSAEVKVKILEKMTIQGNPGEVSTKETDSVVLQDGKIVVNHVSAVTFVR